MPGSEITISQYTPNPPIQLPDGYSSLEVKGYYSNDYIAVDGVTPVLGNFNSGQSGFYYSTTPTINGSGDLVVPAHNVQPTVGSNPSARYTEDLWVDGAFYQRLMPNTAAGTGWQIPTVYGDPITYDEIATYNRAATLVYPPNTYFTADQTIQEILRLSGILNYAGVGILGRTELDFAPAVASIPIAVGSNSPVIAAFTLHASKYGSFNLAVAAINALGGGTVVVDSASPVTTNISVPFTVVTQFQGQGQLTGSSKTVTFVGPLVAPPVQIFASGVTASFLANQTLTEVFPEWWGAVGDNSTDCSTALNAANTALVTLGSGTIVLGPGIYRVGSTVTLGTTATTTGISIRGSNGLVGSSLRWIGSTSGVMLQIVRGRSNRLNDIFMDSTVAFGSTIGLWFTGPAAGTQTTGCTITNVTIRDFHIGSQAGGPGSTAASELTFIACYFSENEIGFASTASGNTLNILFLNCSAGLNETLGYDLGAGSGVIHIVGGGIQANGAFNNLATGDIRMSLGWNGTVNIQNVRFEPGDGGSSPGGGGVFNVGGMGIVKVASAEWSAGGTVTYPFFRGLGEWTIDSCFFGADAQDGWVLYNADGAGSGSFTVINSQIQNTNTRTTPGGGNNTTMLGIQFDPNNGGSWGMKITAANNFYTNTGAVTKFDNLDPAIIGSTAFATGKVYVSRRINANSQVTSDWFDWADQDTTPSVKWSTAFKTGNTGATSYTTFDDGVDGQTIFILVKDANTTFVNGAMIANRSGSNIVATNGFTYSYTKDGTVWRQN